MTDTEELQAHVRRRKRRSEATPGGKREKIRAKPGVRETYRCFIFLLGVVCIGIGLGLAVLPGPLTIPPILLGLWIWSTEFKWADRLFDRWEARGRQAWRQAKRHPKKAATVTLTGLIAAATTFYFVNKYDLVDRATEIVGF